MSVQLAYQEVIAGRVREDEQIAFFGKNKVAVPGRVIQITNPSAQQQPTLATSALAHEGIGKPGTVSENISAYNQASYNTGV